MIEGGRPGGRISDPQAISRFEAKYSIRDDGCWEWTAFRHPIGYGMFRVGRKVEYAHRASYRIHIGPLPYGSLVLHTCDRPWCVNPEHLAQGSPADNAHDRDQKGRLHAKLAEPDIRAIRAKLAGGASNASLAREYRVSSSVISNIKRGVTWAWVK